MGIVIGATCCFNAFNNFGPLLNSTPADTVKAEDRAMFAQMASLRPSPLPPLRASLESIIDYLQMEKGAKISSSKGVEKAASESDKGKEENALKPAAQDKVYGYLVKSDKMGKYAPVSISVDGDIYDQIEFLRMIEERFSQTLFVDAVKGSSNNLSIEARIYGEG